MPRLVNFVFIATMLVALAPASAQEAGEIQDATIAAPGAHAVEFENDHVRVISAIASAGHKSPMHSHPPLVVISLGTGRIKLTNADGSEAIANFRPGMVFWGEGGAHEWELLAGEVNAIAVEIKSAAQAGATEATVAGGDTPAGSTDGVQDATIAAPGAHSVVMENEHVRVISAIAAAGHKSPMHSHPPLVAVSLGTARGKLTDADGAEVTTNVRPGTVWWSDGGAHEWELLAGEIDVIAVEVKAAMASTADSGADDME